MITSCAGVYLPVSIADLRKFVCAFDSTLAHLADTVLRLMISLFEVNIS